MKSREKDDICFGDVCIDSSPFDKSIHYVESQNIRDTEELILDEECNLLEATYIKNHLLSALYFFAWFAFFGMIITLLHECITLIAYLSYGYDFEIVVITIDSGDFISNIPHNAPYWWYILAFLSPYIFVEAFILIIMLITLRIGKKATYLDGKRHTTLRNQIIKRSIGWFCAARLLSTFLLFPIYNIVYWLFGIPKESDLMILWKSTTYLSNSVEVLIIQLTAIFFSALLLVIGGLYMNSMRKNELAI